MSLLGRIITGTVITAILAVGGASLIYLANKRFKEMNEYSSWVEKPAQIEKTVIGNPYKTMWAVAAAKRPKDTDSTYGIDIDNYLIIMDRSNPQIKNSIVHDGDTVNYPFYDKLARQKANFRDFVSSICNKGGYKK